MSKLIISSITVSLNLSGEFSDREHDLYSEQPHGSVREGDIKPNEAGGAQRHGMS